METRKIILHTSDECGRCPIIKMFLDEHNLQYEETSDQQVMIDNDIDSYPAMEVDGQVLDYRGILHWLIDNDYYSF